MERDIYFLFFFFGIYDNIMVGDIMIEIIDRATMQKMMAMIVCGLCYQGDCYLIYCIRRNNEEANVFVSKLIKGSMGYVIDTDFSNGEKEVLDGTINRILNKESKEVLERDGFTFLKDIEMDSNLTFDIEKCYVSTVSRGVIKNCLIYYGLVTEKMFNQPVVEVIEDKRKFNEGFASSVVLIVFGVIIILISCFAIYSAIAD